MSPFLSAALLMILVLSPCSGALGARNAASQRIMYVSDPSSIARRLLPDPVREEDLRKWIDTVADNGADMFVQDVYNQAYTVYLRLDRFQYDKRSQHNRFLPLLDAGIQPIQVMLDQSHKRGMQFLAGFRMNDTHNFPVLAEFIQSHPEWHLKKLRAEDYKDGTPLDFSFDGVRDHFFEVMKEVATTFDVDGLEICFRNPGYFPHPEGRKRAHLMTDMVRRVRAMLDEHGESEKRKIVFGARVFSTLEECLDMGLDVPTWIAEDLIDYVSPMDAFYTDFNAPYVEFGALTRNSECKMYPGVHSMISMRRRYALGKRQFMTPSNYRAIAQTFYAAGADGVSFFNHHFVFNHHHFAPDDFIFGDVRDPHKVAHRTRHYVFDPTWEVLHRKSAFGQDRTISGALKGHKVFLDRSADRPSGVFPLRMYEKPRRVRAVRLLLGGKLTDRDKLEVKLNRTPLAPGGDDPWPADEPGCQIRHLQSFRSFPVPPKALVSGENKLTITLAAPDPDASGEIVIDEVQVLVDPA